MSFSNEVPTSVQPRQLVSGLHALVILLLSLGVFYRDSLGIGLLSDAYYILDHVRHGFLHALTWDHSYHYVPVTNLFLALLWKLSGLHGPDYQGVSLLQLVLNSWLLFFLGRRWLKDAYLALLAALLFFGNSSFYEVTCWSVNGNLHNLSATWTLLAMLALDSALTHRRPVLGGWTFAALTAIAFLTYELTISLTVVGALVVWLRLADFEGVRPWAWLRGPSSWKKLVLWLGPTVAVGLAAVGSKVYFDSLGMEVTNAVGPYWQRLYLLIRGVISLFTATAPEYLIYRRLVLGLPIGWGEPAMKVILVVWAVCLVAAVVWILRRTPDAATRILVLWVAAHLVLSHLFTGITSRHLFLAALPGSLLMALAARAAARRLGAWIPRRLAVVAVALAVVYGMAMSHKYIQRAIQLHLDAFAASQSLVTAIDQQLAERPRARRVLLLDMPAILPRRGIGSYVFINGLHQQVAFAFPDRLAPIDLRHTPSAPPARELANASKPIGRKGLRARLGDPRWIVLRFDPETWRVRPVESSEVEKLLLPRSSSGP